MTENADVLYTYEFDVQIAEEDVRDGIAPAWEIVVAALAAEVRALRLAAQKHDEALRLWRDEGLALMGKMGQLQREERELLK